MPTDNDHATSTNREHFDERVTQLETQIADIAATVAQVREILEMPSTFWAWCGRWGRRISVFSKFATPVVAFLVAIDQFFHIDVWALVKAALRISKPGA